MTNGCRCCLMYIEENGKLEGITMKSTLLKSTIIYVIVTLFAMYATYYQYTLNSVYTRSCQNGAPNSDAPNLNSSKE